MSRKHALDSVLKASDKYVSAQNELNERREVLASACRRAARAGATHSDIAIRTNLSRQRISQFLLDGELHRG